MLITTRAHISLSLSFHVSFCLPPLDLFVSFPLSVSLIVSLSLSQVPTHRWRKCLSETSTFFGPVLGEMIVQEIFPQETKELVGILLPPPKHKLSFTSFSSYHSQPIHCQGQVASLFLTNVSSFFGSEGGYWSVNALIAKIVSTRTSSPYPHP